MGPNLGPGVSTSQIVRNPTHQTKRGFLAMKPTKCHIHDGLVQELSILNSKLNSLSPHWVRSEQAREEVQEQRETLQAELKEHRRKGHDGKRCPSFDPRVAV